MGTVLGTGLQMVKDLLPEQVGTNKRWTDAFVQAVIACADRAVRERIGVHFHTQVITLANDTATYDLDPEFVSIDTIEFSTDGTTYDWRLEAQSLKGMSDRMPAWRDSRGTRPDLYALLSTPGTQGQASPAIVPSQVVIYPCLASVTSETIRVTGSAVIGNTTDLATATVGTDILKKCHLPYVLSVLYAVESPERAQVEYDNFIVGCQTVKSRFGAQGETPSRAVR